MHSPRSSANDRPGDSTRSVAGLSTAQPPTSRVDHLSIDLTTPIVEGVGAVPLRARNPRHRARNRRVRRRHPRTRRLYGFLESAELAPEPPRPSHRAQANHHAGALGASEPAPHELPGRPRRSLVEGHGNGCSPSLTAPRGGARTNAFSFSVVCPTPRFFVRRTGAQRDGPRRHCRRGPSPDTSSVVQAVRPPSPSWRLRCPPSPRRGGRPGAAGSPGWHRRWPCARPR